MRLLPVILSIAALAGAGTGQASVLAATPSPGDALTAVQVDDHAAPAWHFVHHGRHGLAAAR